MPTFLIEGNKFPLRQRNHFTPRTRLHANRGMGGKSENTSECKSVTNSSRNLPSQDDKGSEAKGRKHNGRSASGDKKNENTQPSKLTYTSEEDIYYEPGGKWSSKA